MKRGKAKAKGQTKGKTNDKQDHDLTEDKREPFDLLKAVKLRMDKGLSYKDIAKIVGVAPQTVQERMKRLGDAFNDPERLEVLKQHEPAMLDGVRAMLLERMATELGNVKSNISFSQLALGYGIILDKTRLLRGQNVASLNQIAALIHAAHRPQVTDKGHSDKAIDITPEGEGTEPTLEDGDTRLGL